MRPLTDAQFWGGMAITVLALIAIAAGFLWHWRKIDKDILRDDRKQQMVWARRYAEQLARERLAELLRNVRINVPVTIINESDIDWGEAHEEQREDDAA